MWERFLLLADKVCASAQTFLRWSRLSPPRERKDDRIVLLSLISLPVVLGIVGWKVTLVLATPSVALLANIVVTLGVVAAKWIAIRTHRSDSAAEPSVVGAATAWRAYRISGWVVLSMSLFFVAAAVPMTVGLGGGRRYDESVAIAIATVTFVELACSLAGAWAARRRGSVLVEAIKLVNLAMAATLLVLTQTALLSLTGGDSTSYNGIAGLVLGAAATLVGIHMIRRASTECPTKARDRALDSTLSVDRAGSSGD